MELAIAASFAAVSVAATYAFCIRPIRRGQHCAPATTDNDIARLKAEIARLRIEHDEQAARGACGPHQTAAGGHR